MHEMAYHSVIVVGAGMAGLTAARDLQVAFPDVLVVEASNRIGGRIDQVEGIAPWPVELGPEFIHGAKSSFLAVLQGWGCQLREYEWPDRWFFPEDASGRLRDKHSSKDPDLEAVHEAFANIGAEQYPAQDVSMATWLQRKGFTRRQLGIANACYANDFGCTLAELGLRETIKENRLWDAGESYLVLDRSLQHLVQHLAAGLRTPVLRGWPVTRVVHSAEGATLLGPRGQALHCRHVVVTVPITVLQQGGLSFEPMLPVVKRQAIARIKMGNAIKVVLAFSRAFWAEDFFDVICPHGFIPEFWVTRCPKGLAHQERRGWQHVMVGFVAGAKADAMTSLGPDVIYRQTLMQLDEIFGTCSEPYPASGSFETGHIKDWSQEEHIWGGYSHPSLHATVDDRDLIAEPVDDTVFFAGEATHHAVNPCLQAAMETGSRAAAQILSASKRQHHPKL